MKKQNGDTLHGPGVLIPVLPPKKGDADGFAGADRVGCVLAVVSPPKLNLLKAAYHQ